MMSRLYFHTRDEGTVEVLGAERAYIGNLIKDLARPFLPHGAWGVRDVLPLIAYGERGDLAEYADHPRAAEMLRLSFDHAEATFTYGGKPVRNLPLGLNTVLAIGNDFMCLLARLDGQCEIHSYVEGPHRAWMAELIEQALTARVLRGGVGWNDVIELLRSRDDAPVVTSHSVSESFPNESLADWQPPQVGPDEGDLDYDAWYNDYTDAERWDMAIKGLRAQTGRYETELSPETLRDRFGHRLTLMDVLGQEKP